MPSKPAAEILNPAGSDPANTAKLDRRRWLSVSAAASVAVVAGCPQPAAPEPETAPTTSTVPLRLLMVADEATADIVRRGWSAVSEQPLKIQLIDAGPRLDSLDQQQVIAAAQKSDIVWVPHFEIADLAFAKAIVPIKDDAMLETVDTMLPAIRNRLTTYAGEVFSVPLGPSLPAVLTSESVGEAGIPSWAEYDRVVGEVWNGKAAEPTAAGWATMMFLWRCNGHVARWLFDQNDFAPLIADDDYVAVLEQMKRTHDRYEVSNFSPGEIMTKISAGELQGGISYPIASQQSDAMPLEMMPLPQMMNNPANPDQDVVAASKVLLDMMTPVLAIPKNCRQTSASKTFIRWITGGESSQNARRELPGVFSNSPRTMASSSSSNRQQYEVFRDQALSGPLTMPGITILKANDYYQSLDQSVRACLYDDQSAKKALAQAAKTWNDLTKQTGKANQLRAWRRARGLRG